ncbi:MAG: hypothetical protein R6V75_01760 [Bacteroidales bacterium]
MRNKYLLRWIPLLLAVFAIIEPVGAQNLTTSPYSRFGIGDLVNRTTGRGQAMGGLSAGLQSSRNLNLLNPASLGAFDTLNFIFEMAAFDRLASLQSADLQRTTNNIGVSYVGLAFPITRWWKAGAGVLPFSNVGYNMASKEEYPQMGSVTSRFSGSGGISQFLVSQAITPLTFRVSKKAEKASLSLGLNFSYLFGPVAHTKSLIIPTDSMYFSTYATRTAIIGDVALDYGAQLHVPLPKDYFITLGGTFKGNSDLRTESRYLVTSVGSGFTDTLLYEEDPRNSVILPMSWTGGLTFGKKNKLTAGLEYRTQNWSESSFLGIKDSMANSRDFIAGVEYIPNLSSLTRYLHKVRYRAGLRYSETYLQLNGEQLTEFGITFGAGFPIQDRNRTSTQSSLNVILELGRRGTLQKELIRETYGTLTLQLTLHDFWFQKYKYD